MTAKLAELHDRPKQSNILSLCYRLEFKLGFYILAIVMDFWELQSTTRRLLLLEYCTIREKMTTLKLLTYVYKYGITYRQF